ncbi:MAG: SHOCT domain-containing protein [Planctomycetota bacterium]
MAMWNRFKRMVKSNVNRLRADPDPLVRGLGGSQDKLDENLVTLKAHLRVLEKQIERLQRREAELAALVQASAAHAATTKALTHETELLEVRRQLAEKQADLQQTQAALERAQAVKAAYREVLDEKPAVGPAPSVAPPSAPPSAGAAASAEAVAAWEAEQNAAPRPEPAPLDLEIRVQPRGQKTIGDAGSGPVVPGLEESREISPKTLGERRESEPVGGEALLKELEKLGKLRESGALTEDEFTRAKRRLLGG